MKSRPFLFQVAEYLLGISGGEFSRVAVILPNRRAGLFLRRHLAGLIKDPCWSPSIFSIEEFTGVMTALKEVDQVHCLLELYRIHRELEREKAQPFDDFISWAPQLLSDFNELDRYLVDPLSLFSYLDEVRAITVWNPDNTPLTDFQKQYLRFYHSLLAYYRELTDSLLARGEAYQGLIFRRAWHTLERGEAELPWREVLFAGFNALTTSEERIIDFLVKEGRARLLWDADSYYMEDRKQEAGDYLRRWFRKWPESSGRWTSDDLRSGSTAIRIIGVPDLTGQVKLAGNLLNELQQKGLLNERTAVVLPDDRLLLPLLNSLPPEMEAVNITMGISLDQAPLASLVEKVYHMHHQAMKLASGNPAAARFYFRDVLEVLQHPVVRRLVYSLMGGNESVFRELVGLIRSGRRPFYRSTELVDSSRSLFHDGLGFLRILFTSRENPGAAITGLQDLVELVVQAMRNPMSGDSGTGSESDFRVDLEYAYAISRILNQLRLLHQGSADFLTWNSMATFLRLLFRTTRIPFYGEPLKGLQIMGMLETRTLDFERVFILSCNEGILPSGKEVNSFIPFDVRRNFKLPDFRQRDAVYAYHFYRLIQRADQVWLIYNTEPGRLGGGDPSRFIRQIDAELPLYSEALSLRKEVLVTPLLIREPAPDIGIEKEPDVMEKLFAKASSGFAPTALNAYRSCPLRFYFTEIAGLKEPEEPQDEIDPRILGSAVHHALKSLFTPYKGTPLTKKALESMDAEIGTAVNQGFREFFPDDRLLTGKNLLLAEVARIMIRNFLRGEISQVEALRSKGEGLTVIMLEQPLSGALCLDAGGTELQVRIKGFVDRVDRLGGVTRVIDYKTGSVNKGEVALGNWDDLLREPSLDKGFQLLVYAWLLKGDREISHMNAGVLSLKKQGAGFMAVTVPGEESGNPTQAIGKRELKRTEETLLRIVGEIYDPLVPFRQTSDPELCTRCPFVNLCNR